MASIKESSLAADVMADLMAAHANYERLKEEAFAKIAKITGGKMNTSDVPSAVKWLAFVKDNPQAVTNTKYNVSDYELKVEAYNRLTQIEKLETKDQGHSKALRDIIVSDLRFYWSTAEDFYIEEAEIDVVIKEKYKDLPTISPKRKSDNQIEKDFKKLEVRRNKKTDDATLMKV